MKDTELIWIDALPPILSLRHSVNRQTGYTSFKLKCGRPFPRPLGTVGPPTSCCANVMFKWLNHMSTSLCLQGLSLAQEKPELTGEESLLLKVFKRKWQKPRWTGPFRVVDRTHTAVQLQGKGRTRYHLPQCKGAKRSPGPGRGKGFCAVRHRNTKLVMDRDLFLEDEELASVKLRQPLLARRRDSKRECRNCCCWMLMLIIFVLIIAGIAWLVCMLYDHARGPSHFSGSAITHSWAKRSLDDRNGLNHPTCQGLELEYVLGQPKSFTFDICSVINCGTDPNSWRDYDVYICFDYTVHRQCVTRGKTGALQQWCRTWGSVTHWTGSHWDPLGGSSLENTNVQQTLEWWKRMQFQRAAPTGHMTNPVTLSLQWDNGPALAPNNWTLHLLLGVDISGKDPLGIIKINMKPRPLNETLLTTPIPWNASTPQDALTSGKCVVSGLRLRMLGTEGILN